MADAAALEQYLLSEHATKVWIEGILNITIGNKFHEELRDGIILCELIEKIQPRSIPRINKDNKLPFFQIKWNIIFFIEQAIELGVPKSYLFSEKELYDVTNPPKTILVLESLHNLLNVGSKIIKYPKLTDITSLLVTSKKPSPIIHKDRALLANQVKEVNLLKGRVNQSKIQSNQHWEKSSRTRRNSEHERRNFLALNSHRGENLKRNTELLELFANNEGAKDKLVKLQALVRMYKARKNFQKAIRIEAYRHCIVGEIYKTEQVYVENLQILLDVYLVPLKQQEIVPVHHIHAVIEIIVAFGKLLLEELTPKIEQWNVHSCVGEIFIKIADYMKVYSHYIADYGLFLNSLIKSVKDPVFGPLLKKCAADPRAKMQPIESYMILPVQRIPRYELLLKDLTKRTLAHHKDYTNLQTACLKMQDVATHVNEKQAAFESILKVVSLQKLFVGNLAPIPHRRYVKDSDVSLLISKSSEAIRLFAFSDIVVLSRPKKKKFVILHTIQIGTCTIEKSADIPNTFQITNGEDNAVYTITTSSLVERDAYVDAIAANRNAIIENEQTRQSVHDSIHKSKQKSSTSSTVRHHKEMYETILAKKEAPSDTHRRAFMKQLSGKITPGTPARDVLELVSAENEHFTAASPAGDKRSSKKDKDFHKQLGKALRATKKEKKKETKEGKKKDKESKEDKKKLSSAKTVDDSAKDLGNKLKKAVPNMLHRQRSRSFN